MDAEPARANELGRSCVKEVLALSYFQEVAAVSHGRVLWQTSQRLLGNGAIGFIDRLGRMQRTNRDIISIGISE